MLNFWLFCHRYSPVHGSSPMAVSRITVKSLPPCSRLSNAGFLTRLFFHCSPFIAVTFLAVLCVRPVVAVLPVVLSWFGRSSSVPGFSPQGFRRCIFAIFKQNNYVVRCTRLFSRLVKHLRSKPMVRRLIQHNFFNK